MCQVLQMTYFPSNQRKYEFWTRNYTNFGKFGEIPTKITLPQLDFCTDFSSYWDKWAILQNLTTRADRETLIWGRKLPNIMFSTYSIIGNILKYIVVVFNLHGKYWLSLNHKIENETRELIDMIRVPAFRCFLTIQCSFYNNRA